MNALFEVKEYDKIIRKSCYTDKFEEKDKYVCLEDEDFDNLKAFITEFEKQDNGADVLEFMKVDYKRDAGEIVSLKNHVGLVQMKNGFQIQILPKISFYPNEDNGNVETKRIFLRMLRSLKEFPSKMFNSASLQVDRMNLYEVFIRMYLQEVLQLVKHGIKSDYVEKEDNLKFFKGKLLVNKHIRMRTASLPLCPLSST